MAGGLGHNPIGVGESWGGVGVKKLGFRGMLGGDPV